MRSTDIAKTKLVICPFQRLRMRIEWNHMCENISVMYALSLKGGDLKQFILTCKYGTNTFEIGG